MGIADVRREYTLDGLARRSLDPDPIVQFKSWFNAARGASGRGRLRKFFVSLYKSFLVLGGAEPIDVNAMTLATVDKEGRPSARVVLLKGVDDRGFVFYSNYHSRKGHHLEDNPRAALVFYWADLERQVGVSGEVHKLPPAESDTYFRSRPRGSQIGAWASNQSEPVPDRLTLERQWREFEARFPGHDVPRSPHWGGYVLTPDQVEFWQGRPNRLHDRFRYRRGPGGVWAIERLSP